MKKTLTDLAALAIALTLFGTGPALTFSSNHERSHQARLQIPKQVHKAVKPKSIKSKAVKSKTFKLKAVTTVDSKKKKQSASTQAHSLVKTVAKPQKTKIPAASTRTRKAIATIPDQTRKSRKRTIPSTAAITKAKAAAEKAAQQKLKDESKAADGGPQPEPPTTPKRNLLPPKLDRTVKTGNKQLDDFGHLREAADAMRDLGHLRDAANRGQWGQEQETWPENGHGMPGDDLNGRAGGDLPSGAKQLETEGAPDQAAYFNEPIPRPGGSGGQTAPDDAGPQRGYWRPSHDGATSPRGPGDVKDSRGLASDSDVFNNEHDGDQSGTRFETNEDGGFTHTTHDEHGRVRRKTHYGDNGIIDTTYDEKGRLTSRRTYDADNRLVQESDFEYRDGHVYETRRTVNSTYDFYIDFVDGDIRDTRVDPHGNPNPTEDNVSDWEMLDWARAGRRTGMLAPHDRRTLSEKTDGMVGQPGREGAGNGTAAAPRLGRDAVTNEGDSSFNVAPVTPLGYGHGSSGGVVGGCITCYPH